MDAEALTDKYGRDTEVNVEDPDDLLISGLDTQIFFAACDRWGVERVTTHYATLGADTDAIRLLGARYRVDTAER